MTTEKIVVFPKAKLTDEQRKQLHLAKTALDALLQLNGYVSVALPCTEDERIKAELEDTYSKIGWQVRFIQAVDSNYYYIEINS